VIQSAAEITPKISDKTLAGVQTVACVHARDRVRVYVCVCVFVCVCVCVSVCVCVCVFI